ncbi:MAG TPA: flagellar hook-length control protein FliK [Azonexus sp.]|nr:flagellar hook-length control protein FliK [Azonexus sp.]
MGLSVIPKIPTSANTSLPSAPADAAAGGLPGEFAALLSGQTLAALLSQGSPAQTAEKATDSRDTGLGTETAATDVPPAIDPAALVALMGNPHIQPIAQTAAQPAAEATSRDQELAVEIDSRPDGGNGTAANMAALKAAAMEPASPNSATALGKASETAGPANIAAPADTSGNTPAFAANLAALTRRPETATHQPPAVNAPLHTETWPQQFGEKVVWMAKSDLQTAQININPPQLGPIQITLNLSGDQATAIFASPHAEVRQAIESSMPQLRDMLASAGINLGDANVGANLAQQQQNNAFQSPNRAQSALENAILPANDNAPVAGAAMPLKHGRGLVDLFA